MGNIKTYTALGIMSSTSYEGVGLAKLSTDGVDISDFGAAYITPFEEKMLDDLRRIDGKRATDSPDAANQIRHVEIAFTKFCAELVKNYLADNPEPIDVIGFAGHTICHKPSEHYTHQIGDGKMLAELAGIKTVSGFRNADILNGGQGAPFSPIYYEGEICEREDSPAYLSTNRRQGAAFLYITRLYRLSYIVVHPVQE